MRKLFITTLFIVALFVAALPPSVGAQGGQGGQGWLLVSGFAGTGQSSNQEVFRLNLDGGSLQNLTNDPAKDSCSVLSPDGQRIAFVSNRGGESRYNIYVIDVNGENAAPVTKNSSAWIFPCPTFSPDGKHIVYAAQVETGQSAPEILSVDVSTGDQKNLAPNLTFSEPSYGKVWDLVFLKGGNRILFASNHEDGYMHLYSLDASGGSPQRIGDYQISEPYYEWERILLYSPAGDFVFIRVAGSYVMLKSDGENWTEGITVPAKDGLAISPDGKHIAYINQDNNVAIMDVDGSNQNVLTSTTPGNGAGSSYDWNPMFSYDGSKILFVRSVFQGDGSVVQTPWVMDTDGNNKAEVSALNNVNLNSIAWNSSSPLVTDGSGNVYPTVPIGDQVWMAENLRTTTYNDGTDIPFVSDATEWTTQTAPAYTWSSDIGDNAQQRADYGPLYNEYAIQQPGLCPVGWRVPTEQDFKTLFAGSDIHLKLQDPAFWDSADASMANGFNARPTGLQSGDTPSPGARDLGSIAYFWYYPRVETKNFAGVYADRVVYGGRVGSSYGLSVRCIQE